MRLKRLFIAKFKNLIDFTIEFNNDFTIVFLGRNASAKSNLMEAIVIIFKALDLKEAPPFDYVLEYTCNGTEIKITSQSKTLAIEINGSKIGTQDFYEDSQRRYLPKHVFGYYSGTSQRLESHFERHQNIFYHQQLDNIEMPLRPLFYAQTIHSQYVLLAFFSFKKDNSAEFLRKYLGITKFENAELILKEPEWFNKQKNKDDYFWGARGLVRKFLDELRASVNGPLKIQEKMILPSGESKSECHIYLRIDDLAQLRSFASKYGSYVDFFKTLETTYLSKLILELKIRFRKEGIDSILEFSDLSEGEQQLLTVLGLLKFTKQDESLFLLDEPDTHLNPRWKYEYIDILKEVVGENETSQIIIITHDPLLIAGLRKEQVRIFSIVGADKRAQAKQPEFDPIGMGFTGLLTSDMFDFNTTLDKETQQKLDLKKALTVKEKLTNEEREQLAKLDDELENLGFMATFRDPLYTTFLKAIQKYELFNKKELSSEERKRLDELALKIVQEIKVDD
jgi:predicted ATPase